MNLVSVAQCFALIVTANIVPPAVSIVIKKRCAWPVDGSLNWFDGRLLFGRSKTLPEHDARDDTRRRRRHPGLYSIMALNVYLSESTCGAGHCGYCLGMAFPCVEHTLEDARFS